MSEKEREAMEPGTERTRRRFIGAVGAVTGTTLVAGCGGNGGDADGTNNTTDGTGTETEMDTDEESETETETDEESETETETESGGAMVRVAHLSPDAPNVDVYVDDEPALEDVAFGDVSDYLELEAGTYAVRVTPAGDSETTVFEGDVPVESGMSYTIAAIGEVSEDGDEPFEPVVLEDDNEPPESDTARLRAVHASPDAPAVDITAGETVLFDGVEYGESGYTEVPEGDYTVEIRADTEEGDGDVVYDADVTLEGGQVYSAFAAGYLTPDDEPESTEFELIVTQDTAESDGEGTETETGTDTETDTE